MTHISHRREAQSHNERDFSAWLSRMPSQTVAGRVFLKFVTALTYASSMTIAENEAVRARQDSYLQVVAVCNLVTLSSDPTALTLGLQSLAGLHAYSPWSFDQDLGPYWFQLQTLFNWQLPRLRGTTSWPDASERLLRAGLHQNLNCHVVNQVLQPILRKGMIPETAPILALSAKRCLPLTFNLRDLLVWIMRKPYAELLKLHPCDLFLIRDAVSPFLPGGSGM